MVQAGDHVGRGALEAAYALSRKGLRVRVLEKAPEFGEVGAGMQLAPNCTRILDEFGLLDQAKDLGVVPRRMVMRDAVGAELTALDLVDLEREYGYPYLVIHRSDLHGLFLRACQQAGVDLRTDQEVIGYAKRSDGARVTLADGTEQHARVVIAADGLHSVARRLLVDDQPVSSAYVAYRAAVPLAQVGQAVDLDEVVVYVGPRCHFVQYGLRGGEMLNDELDGAFADTCQQVREGIPMMWRDRWWRMYDRDPIDAWVHGRTALLGDAAHPPLQYMAQGAIIGDRGRMGARRARRTARGR